MPQLQQQQLSLAFRRQSDRPLAQRRHGHQLLLSGFTDHEKAVLAEGIVSLGGKYLDSKVFVPDCTHVVSIRPMRSEKYLCACASGKWIVTPEFVTESLAAGQWLDEGPYVWGSPGRTGRDATAAAIPPMESAPARWLDHLKRTKRRAFTGWTAAILVSCINNRPAVYKRLIECGGGVVLSLRGPQRQLDKVAKLLDYVFVDKCYEEKVRPLREQGVPCLVPEFIAEFLFEKEPNQKKYSVFTYTPELKNPLPNGDKQEVKECPPTKGCPSGVRPRAAIKTKDHLPPGPVTSSTSKPQSQPLGNGPSSLSSSQPPASPPSAPTDVNPPPPAKRQCRPWSPSRAPTPGGPCPSEPATTAASSSLSASTLAAGHWTGGLSRPAEVAVKRRLEFSPSLVREKIADEAQKQAVGNYSRVPYWMQVRPPKYQDTEEETRPFSRFVSGLIEAYLEEEFWLRAVQSIHANLSARTYPPPSLLHAVMIKVLESTDAAYLNHALHLLKSVLCLHHPCAPQMAPVYLRSFLPPDEAGAFGLESDDPIRSHWDFLGSVIRKSLQKPCKEADTKDTDKSSSKTADLRGSGELLLGYIVALLEQDYQGHLYRVEGYPSKRPRGRCLLSTILWPSNRVNGGNASARQLVAFLLQAVVLAEESPSMYPCLKMVMSLVEIAAECCRTAAGDSGLHGNLDYGAHQDLAEEIAAMATKIGLTNRTEALNMLLCLLQPDWLKLRVTECLARRYDDRLVPREHRSLADQPLSLKKVVNYCFYLIPPIAKKAPPLEGTAEAKEGTQASRAQKRSRCPDNSSGTPLMILATSNTMGRAEPSLQDRRSARKNNKVNGRNMRGETPLHLACIRDEPDRVHDLLTCPTIQVNLTDYAGWTALHEASNHGHVDCVRELLKYRPKQKITAYFTLDKTKKCSDALDLLAAPTQCGTTALHDAVFNGHTDVAELLVKAGGKAVLVARNKEGKTPLDIAEYDAMRSVLQLTGQDAAGDCCHDKENTRTDPAGQKRTEDRSEEVAAGGSAQPTEECYSALLGPPEDPQVFFTAAECERLCLLVGHLLQSCLRARRLLSLREDLLAAASEPHRGEASRYSLSSSDGAGAGPADGPAARLMEDLTEMAELEAHLAGFVRHLGRVGPWVGSHKSHICHRVVHHMKVLIAACL